MDNLDNCLARILNVIKVLQNNALKIECKDNSCTKPFLGVNIETVCFNTRPITLYKCDNSLITLNYTNDSGESVSTNIFRVESVSCDSVKVLLLEETTDSSGNVSYLSTNTYATINLKCVCAIKCLPDTIVNNV